MSDILIYWIINIFKISLLISLSFSILLCISTNKIFKKFNKKIYLSFIPLVNIYVFLDIVNASKWCVLLFFIPICNVLMIFVILYRVGILYNVGTSFAFGLLFMFPVFLPILNYCHKDSNEEDISSEDVMINLLTDKEISNMNNEVTNTPVIDSTFKKEIEIIKEDVPIYKSRKNHVLINDEEDKKDNTNDIEIVEL